MTRFDEICTELKQRPLTWVVTGAAGFIGSHLVETLLNLGQRVRGLDNFATGSKDNLLDVKRQVGEENWKRFEFTEGDILHQALCRQMFDGADYVLHQAALGSVPRSVKDPWTSNQVNVDGFISVVLAARDAAVKRVVYASSSSVYGDNTELPKIEDRIGNPLSPYAATKRMNEMYADVFGRVYGISMIGLRYFNVFGPRQNPQGPYAAVIPRWIEERLQKKESFIYGDGTTSRDFCYVANVVQANILAALGPEEASGQKFNIALGDRLSLNELYSIIDSGLNSEVDRRPPKHEDFRKGDVMHSLADISKARRLLGYDPQVKAKDGLKLLLNWYGRKCG